MTHPAKLSSILGDTGLHFFLFGTSNIFVGILMILQGPGQRCCWEFHGNQEIIYSNYLIGLLKI